MKTYYMFGDSLMRGVMPDEAWNYHSSDAIGFEAMQTQYNMKVVNYAMPTFTSERVKMWLTQTMSRQPAPDVAFLECGISREVMSEYVNSVQQMRDEFAEYGDIMRAAARENGCEILSLRESFVALDDMKAYYSKDGMHPNETGYALIHDDFEKYFASHVQ